MLRTTLSTAAAALAVSLLTARAAAAQEPTGARAFCLPGSTTSCFAFAINDVATGFEVWLRNLSPVADADFAPFAIRQFDIRRANAATPDAAGGMVTDISAGFGNANVVATGSARRGPLGLSENTSVADYPAARTFTYDAYGTYGLLGCSLPTSDVLGPSGFVAITCADRGMDGWLRVSFGARVWSAPSLYATPTFRAATADDVGVQVAGCTTHVGALSGITTALPGTAVCASTPFGSTVTPEPGVVWLVGAGLAGAGVAGARRRRARG